MDHHELIARSLEELRLKSAVHDRLWHLSEARWSVDQDTGKITFCAPNGMIAVCSVQIIGTFNTHDSTWLWAWDHPSVQPTLAEHAKRLLEYGESFNISELTTRKLSTTEDLCWEFTALACHLNDAQGAYRARSGAAMVFMTLGDPTISGNPHLVANSDVPIVTEPGFTTDVPADVRSLVEGFIKALYEWEIAAFQASKDDGGRNVRELAQKSYKALIRQWCVSELQPQPMSYSSHPRHHPDTETILSAACGDNGCCVRTRHTDVTGFASDYEYHLMHIDGEWRFQQLYYIDGTDKYESL